MKAVSEIKAEASVRKEEAAQCGGRSHELNVREQAVAKVPQSINVVTDRWTPLNCAVWVLSSGMCSPQSCKGRIAQ